MIEPVNLHKKPEPKPFEFLLKATNHFHDRIFRAMFVSLLFVLDFVLFVYSINGRVLENGVINEAMIYIGGGFFAVMLVLMLLLSFSGMAQNVVCGLFAMIIAILFLDQFALFDVSNFIEMWLIEHASFLTFITIIPSNWMVGLFLFLVIFFAFRSSLVIFFSVMGLICSVGLGVYQTEMVIVKENEYDTVKELNASNQDTRENNIVYLMAPKFPSYHFLSTIKDVNFRELRDMMVGFYAVNGFEIYPNAFVQRADTVSNIVDVYNLVNYASTSSGIRGYAEILNDWDFVHGKLDTNALEDNKLYEALAKAGYKTSSYAMPGFNFCYKGGDMFTDRCVMKHTHPVSLYDKKSSLEKNVFALLGEWVLSFKNRELKSVAKMLMDMSSLKGMRIISENRRLSIEGAPAVFDELYEDFAGDKNGVAYMTFVELPSDLYIYDEFCNLKPRKDWVSLKDNTLYTGGIDLKRKAYADQAKCLLGMMQMFMEKMYQNDKLQNTDIIVHGVSPLRELAGMPAGQYGNFVADKLVSLGIRKGKSPAFLVNTDICLASDLVRSQMLGEKHCYTIDNMKMSTEDALNLTQNLVNNSVIRGSKITNIAAEYRDWYEEFRKKSSYYQAWEKQFMEKSQPLPVVEDYEVIQEEPMEAVEIVTEPTPQIAEEEIVSEVEETVDAKPEVLETSTGDAVSDAMVTEKDVDASQEEVAPETEQYVPEENVLETVAPSEEIVDDGARASEIDEVDLSVPTQTIEANVVDEVDQIQEENVEPIAPEIE
ncbi:MAG: hypothetical protein NC218_05545 [Acetobacter sp.]|nr:hypothetical protein [Acetobacter sp.]